MKTINLPNTILYHYQPINYKDSLNNINQHESLTSYHHKLFIVTKGDLQMQNGNERYSINKGEYLLLPSHTSYYRNPNKNTVYYYINFSFDSDNAITHNNNNLTIDFNERTYFSIPQKGNIPKPEKIIVLLKQLEHAVKSNSPSLVLDSMTTSIIAELCGQIDVYESHDASIQVSKKLHSDIIDYIEQKLSLNIKITDIAEHFGYNEKYLSHQFAETTGIKLKKYIINRKIEYANYMLADTNKCISDIATELGYIDSHNFSRTYKNFTGLTPSEYRNTYIENIALYT